MAPSSRENALRRERVQVSGYRYYSPELGRWPSRDPIEELGGVNIFSFVRNRPVFRVDGFGLSDVVDRAMDVDTLIEAFARMNTKGLFKGVFFFGTLSNDCHIQEQKKTVEPDLSCPACSTGEKHTCRTILKCEPTDRMGTINMLTWNNDEAQPWEVEVFAKVYDVLLAHEKGHQDRFTKHADMLNKRYTAISTACSAEDACYQSWRAAEAQAALHLLNVMALHAAAQGAWEEADYPISTEKLNELMEEYGVDFEWTYEIE